MTLRNVEKGNPIGKEGILAVALILCWALCVGSAQAQQPDFVDRDPTRESKSMPVRYLSEFEAGVKVSPEVLAAVAELEASRNNMVQVQAEGGIRAFAGSSVGLFREQVTNDRSREYHRINLKAGLRYPLLGSKQAEQKSVVDAQSRVAQSIDDREEALRSSVLTLRLQYINYWAAQEKIRLTHLFLENEDPMSAILQERMRTSHLLEADRREFMTTFSMTRRNLARFETIRQRAISMLEFVTGSAIASFSAAYPDLPVPPMDIDRLQALINESHPLILGMKAKVEAHQRLVELADKAYAKGHVSLSSNVSTDLDDSEPGYGVVLEVNFDFPLRLKQAAAAYKAAARASLKKAKRLLELTRARMMIDAQEDMSRYLACDDDIAFALQRLSAAQEQVRENLLRFAFLTGDVIENVQQSRWAYYQAAMDYIDAQMNRLHIQARLLDYAPSLALSFLPSGVGRGRPADLTQQNRFGAPLRPWDPNATTPLDRTHAGSPHQQQSQGLPHFSVYVWNSAQLLRRFQEQPGFLSSLVQSGIHRLLVSFTSHQIQTMDDVAHRGQVIAFINAARRYGMRVELLLGDPLWILEPHRPDLTALIQKLADLPFQAIHLDLEPNQLAMGSYDEADLKAQLIKTLRAVKAVTRLPIGLSIHYRYLLDLSQGLCLGCAFKEIGMDEIALMIYVSNPERVAQIAGPIIRRFPELTFSIAQSVEPILPPEQSYHAQSRDRFLSQMGDLQAALDFKNVRSILIQSWENYNEMRP
jgi:outer membrane protein TolC